MAYYSVRERSPLRDESDAEYDARKADSPRLHNAPKRPVGMSFGSALFAGKEKLDASPLRAELNSLFAN
ncbi:hypothetical protein AGMMS49959_17210 [Planctomycetales bacterium]|nr:hypothetical protein AGMMS49959_17210 [Planctomycetales bacterium]